MPFFVSRTDPSALRRIIAATGLGAIFGFQGWKLVEYGFAGAIPWYGKPWIWIGHMFLGLAIGATAAWTSWWRRAFLFGLAFSIASGCGALLLRLTWAPYSIAAAAEGLVVALLIALLVDAVFPREPQSADRDSAALARLPGTGSSMVETRRSVTRQRLAEEKALLDQLDREREYRRDSNFRKTTEERIVWSELLDLELQDFDEELNRIRQTAGDAPGRRSDRSNSSPGPSPD